MIDVLAALVLVVLPVVTTAEGWDDVEWSVLGFLLAKTAAVTALSYAMRVWLDRSGLPTPLPPEDTEPTVPAPDVVAQVSPAGGLVAGQGAAAIPTGAPVDVTAMT
ncbi:hypothetical protein [Nocardioides nanhaiensis]|uniref:Uncharacterized protein n=1 Tax=Nocardioides nanhaiensis TaxID=1476871 RepID=A0ABP8WZA9_9ACTN